MKEFSKPKRILVAPLDWGLGHATRCIPIINELLKLGCEVLIGAEGKHALLLHKEFPKLIILPLKGYRIHYSNNGARFGWSIIKQIPHIYHTVCYEHRWLKKMIKKYKIEAVISDNRFGLYDKKIPCIVLTHQLLIKSPFNNITETWLQGTNYHFLNRYDECWIVDFKGEKNLAGELSHPAKLPANARYLGCISRFEKKEVEKKYDLLVLISGPEPQRTIFEDLMLAQIRDFPLPALVVSGQPENDDDRMLSATVRRVNHLDAKEMNVAIESAGMIVCRSGYTSLMDLAKLDKKAVLVPTPGQTEQEYLAKYLMEKKFFYSVSQENFKLSEALKAVETFPFRFLNANERMDDYQQIIHSFVASL